MEKVPEYQIPQTKTGQGKEIPAGSKFSQAVKRRTTMSSKEGLDPELCNKRTKNIDPSRNSHHNMR